MDTRIMLPATSAMVPQFNSLRIRNRRSWCWECSRWLKSQKMWVDYELTDWENEKKTIFLKIVLLEMYPPILLLDDYFLFQTSKTHNDLRRERLSQWSEVKMVKNKSLQDLQTFLEYVLVILWLWSWNGQNLENLLWPGLLCLDWYSWYSSFQ